MAKRGQKGVRKCDRNRVTATILQRVPLMRSGVEVDLENPSGETFGYCKVSQGGICFSKDRRCKQIFKSWRVISKMFGC